MFDHSEKVRRLTALRWGDFRLSGLGRSDPAEWLCSFIHIYDPLHVQGSASADTADTFNAWSSANAKLQDQSMAEVCCSLLLSLAHHVAQPTCLYIFAFL